MILVLTFLLPLALIALALRILAAAPLARCLFITIDGWADSARAARSRSSF